MIDNFLKSKKYLKSFFRSDWSSFISSWTDKLGFGCGNALSAIFPTGVHRSKLLQSIVSLFLCLWRFLWSISDGFAGNPSDLHLLTKPLSNYHSRRWQRCCFAWWSPMLRSNWHVLIVFWRLVFSFYVTTGKFLHLGKLLRIFTNWSSELYQ